VIFFRNILRRIKSWLPGILVLVAFVFLGGLGYFYFRTEYGPGIPTIIYPISGHYSHRDFGVIGDFFGGILNPIFSLFGLVLLLATLRQNEKELKLSRNASQKSSDALLQQVETQKQQRFELTFFSLLDQHNKLLDKLMFEGTRISNGNSASVESVVSKTAKSLIRNFNIRKSLAKSKLELLASETVLNQYFRVLYQILKFICIQNADRSFETDNELFVILETTTCSEAEKFYSSIVRSFLPSELYLLLAVNCYATDETDQSYRFKKLIERYSFFEHMPIWGEEMDDYLLMEEVFNHYEGEAFGEALSTMRAAYSKNDE
jgi:hypothetical protein